MKKLQVVLFIASMASWDPGIFDTPEEQVGCVPKQLWKNNLRMEFTAIRIKPLRIIIGGQFFLLQGKSCENKNGYTTIRWFLLSIINSNINSRSNSTSRNKTPLLSLLLIQARLNRVPWGDRKEAQNQTKRIDTFRIGCWLENLELFYFTKIKGCQSLLWWPFHGEKTWIPNVYNCPKKLTGFQHDKPMFTRKKQEKQFKLQVDIYNLDVKKLDLLWRSKYWLPITPKWITVILA